MYLIHSVLNIPMVALFWYHHTPIKPFPRSAITSTCHTYNINYAAHYIELQQCMLPRRDALQAPGIKEYASHISD